MTDTIEDDFWFFSRLSRYKHLSPRGVKVNMVRRKGRQPNYGSTFADLTNDHWWFEEESYDTSKYFIYINCFSRADFWMAHDRWEVELREYLTEKYPDLVDEIYDEQFELSGVFKRPSVTTIVYEIEQFEQLQAAKAVAQRYEQDIAIEKLKSSKTFMEALERWRHSLWKPGGALCEAGWKAIDEIQKI